MLRAPLGLVLSKNDLRDEDAQVHIVAMDRGERVVGCGLVACDGPTARIRQIAIDEQYRERGIGTALMQLAEQTIRERHFGTAVLHARLAARGFFERPGYATVSGVFTEVTIPHVAMRKELAV